ncbi:glutathione S-transferase family protein [Chondromyces crocatus]|uniref:Glutathione S-transferase n=1 Tax=Chondromyces crocatus TaxID=52 RepID=A0A0K1EC14_CHOCO|nr:glutathione S-transferase family protein [Chondromyces crocatus]AKT38217.1 glutathione S-transferase [Chondromyces crocatus]
MITLHGFGPGFGLPEISPFVTKTEIQLKLLGVPYQKGAPDLEGAPKGQLPFIDDDGARIADSHFIREHLEKKLGKDLDAGLDARQRAEAWAIERMLENQLSAVSGCARWLDPDNFAKGPAHFVDGAPEALRPKLREQLQNDVRANYRAMGVARHTDDEILSLGIRSLDALAAFLGDKTYLFGNHPVAVDAIAFGILAGILTPFFDSPLRRRAEGYPTLVAYTARMMREFYPEHSWSAPTAT